MVRVQLLPDKGMGGAALGGMAQARALQATRPRYGHMQIFVKVYSVWVMAVSGLPSSERLRVRESDSSDVLHV